MTVQSSLDILEINTTQRKVSSLYPVGFQNVPIQIPLKVKVCSATIVVFFLNLRTFDRLITRW